LFSFLKYFQEIFDLPAEVIMDQPLIMLVANKRLYIENHKGIALFQEDLIKVRVKDFFIIIKGFNFELERIEEDHLIIVGDFSIIDYEKK